MKRLIVSRHPAAIEFIREQLPEFADAPVLAMATEEDVENAVVAGNLPLHLAARAAEVIAVEFTGNPPRGAEYSLEEMKAAGAVLRRYRIKAMPEPGTESQVIVDFRAGQTHTGFRLVAEPGVRIEKTWDGPVLLGVSLFKDGRTYIARPGGSWDVCVMGTDGKVEALNEGARVLAHDCNASGTGKAILAFRSGGCVFLGAYKGRGPGKVIRWDGQNFERVPGKSAARAAGWIPSDDSARVPVLD